MNAKKLSEALSKDEHAFEVIKNSFDTLILSVPVAAQANIDKLTPLMIMKTGEEKFGETYQILNVETSADNSFIILAEAIIKDELPAEDGIGFMDKVYPCNIYGVMLPDNAGIEFYGNYSSDKLQQYFTKALAGAVVVAMTK